MKTGDRVICIDASNRGMINTPPLIKGREYIIYGTRKCNCGIIDFNVGCTSNPEITHDECSCGSLSLSIDIIHWANSDRFAKVKEQYRIIHMDIEVEEPILN